MTFRESQSKHERDCGQRQRIQTGTQYEGGIRLVFLVYNNLHVVGEHAREEGTQEAASLKVTMGAREAMMCVPGRVDVWEREKR